MEHIKQDALNTAAAKFDGFSLDAIFDSIAKHSDAAAPVAVAPVAAAPESPVFEVTEGSGQFATAADALAYMNGGKATVTMQGAKSRFTYKVSLPKDGDGTFFFVSLLTGPDNWANYSYFGYVRRGVFFHGGAKAKAGTEAPGVKAFTWAHAKLSAAAQAGGDIPAGLKVFHEGKCGRCARKLTVPASILSGFGPECVGKL